MIPYLKFGVKLNVEKTLGREFWRGARGMLFSVLIPTVKINTRLSLLGKSTRTTEGTTESS